VVDPGGQLAELAHGLRGRASALEAAAHAPEQALTSSGWTGRRAQEFAGRLSDRRTELLDRAQECERLAALADGLADDYAAAVRRMHRLEDDVRSWLRTATDAERRLLPVLSLPAPGSPAWAQVAAAARRAGAGL
jgi:hypothetical protein